MKAKYSVLLSLGVTAVFLICAVLAVFASAGNGQILVLAPEVPESLVLTGADEPGAPLKELLPGMTLNINTATAEELTALDGIGEGLAAAIVEYREANGPFETPEDIMQVSGIGEKKYTAIREYITTGDDP